jgi:hypothetical protein
MSDESSDSLSAKADAAFREAAAKVIEQARRTGTRIAVWENGRPVERTWEEMARELTKETGK